MPAAEAETVIVGGGTAGCVLASLLADGASDLIVVLEAGPDYGPFALGRWPADLLDPRSFGWTHEWGYDSGDTYPDRVIPFYRARVLGGCSAHNSCQAVWGHRADYDAWAARGNNGWSARDLEPLFVEASTRMAVSPVGEAEMSPFSKSFLDAAGLRSYPLADDLTSLDGGPGAARLPKNIVGGMRWNTAFAYLEGVRDRVRVIPDALVDRIDIASSRARGVRFTTPNGPQELSAGRVILAAGTYGSPAVLLRSGVGPPDELQAIGIKPKLGLPGVGRNLHDHPQIELIYDGTPRLNAAMADWIHDDPQGISEQAVVKARSSCAGGVFDLHVWANGGMPLGSGWQGGPPFQGDPRNWQWEIGVSCLTPQSRGSLRLRTASPDDSPIIDHRYLSDPDGHDEQVLADGIAIARSFAATPPCVWLGNELPPTVGARSRKALGAAIQANCVHYWHPVGTCAMGPLSDPASVVDATGRVHGLANVYVADASIMPTAPRANTNIPAVVVAHRIAQSLGAAAATTQIAASSPGPAPPQPAHRQRPGHQ